MFHLLEESRSEIELGIVRIKKSESKMELGTQRNVSNNRTLSSPDMSCLEESSSKRKLKCKIMSFYRPVSCETSYKLLRSGMLVGKPKKCNVFVICCSVRLLYFNSCGKNCLGLFSFARTFRSVL